MTALSVGYIQTYRDSVDSLGESVDMSIKVCLCVFIYICLPYFHILLNTKSAMMNRSVQLNKTSWQQQEIDPLSYSFKADQFLVQPFTVLEVAVFLFVLFTEQVRSCWVVDCWMDTRNKLKG